MSATFIAGILFLSIGSAQTQKGQSIKLNSILEGTWDASFRMSGDGNTIVIQDIYLTRTFIWKNNNWDEQTQIKNKRWDYFNISNNGLILAASHKSDLPGSTTKLYVYDFINGGWQLRDGLDETLIDRIGSKAHHFVLSENGKRLFILNCNFDKPEECNLKILSYQNNLWKVELATSFENYRFQYGHCSSDGSTLLVREFYGNKIRIYKFLNNEWRVIYTNFDIGDRDGFSRAISLTAKGDELNCIKRINNENEIAENYIIKYKINDTNIEELFRQKIDLNIDAFTRFSSDGACLVTGSEQDYFQSNRVRLYKFSDNQYSEIETNLINLDTTLYFGVGRNISDDCKTLSIGVSPKELVAGLSEIRVYDISNLTNAVSEDYDLKQIKIYPNPSQGYLNIIGFQSPVDLTISNISGQVLLHQNLETNQIDINQFPSGVYICAFRTAKNVATFKIIKSE
jgi:hypothetical protein